MKLDNYLDKAGIHVETSFLKLLLFRFAIFLNLAMSGYVMYRISQLVDYTITYVIIVMAVIWTLAFLGLVIIVWFLFLLILEFKILKRTENIEDHLPEYLMATATNIRAGMDLEQAMWSSIKPKYGVLSEEIEIVAKKVMGGKDINTAMIELKDKYKSDLLKRSIDLIIEGKESGGQIAHLLTDLGENVQQIQNIRKEVASSVTAYIIFIGFSTILAAPFLFGISEQLITATQSITSGIDLSALTNSPLPTPSSSITPKDFRIFAVSTIVVLNFFSAILNGILKTGKAAKGMPLIIPYIVISLIVFFVSSKALSGFLGSFV